MSDRGTLILVGRLVAWVVALFCAYWLFSTSGPPLDITRAWAAVFEVIGIVAALFPWP